MKELDKKIRLETQGLPGTSRVEEGQEARGLNAVESGEATPRGRVEEASPLSEKLPKDNAGIIGEQGAKPSVEILEPAPKKNGEGDAVELMDTLLEGKLLDESMSSALADEETRRALGL